MHGAREHRPGDLWQVTKITKPDPDSYAVIHMGRYAYAVGRAWFEQNKPEVGGYIDVDPATGDRVFVAADKKGAR
jgi:hypothetical protein